MNNAVGKRKKGFNSLIYRKQCEKSKVRMALTADKDGVEIFERRDLSDAK